MCGIVVVAQSDGPVAPERLDRALSRLAHRGPDGEGTIRRWDDRLLIGHRRLAIFDTGRGGQQPMVSARGDLLAFNGSIYNYIELREQLRQLGHVFASRSDTEVILAAWAQWGEGAFERFNGTWALALHDAASDSLIISRDRLGVRPLYCWRDASTTVIASEVRAVVAAAGLSVRVNPDMAFDFLTLGLSDHEDRTMVDGIVEVPAGSLWRLDRGGRLSRQRYHQWPQPEPELDRQTASTMLSELLEDATRLRLRADVPVAAQLSGGMDSGSVAWAIGQRQDDLAASFRGFFSYGYDATGAEFDEIPAAIATRNHVAPALPLTEVRVNPLPDMQELESFLAAQELPVSTPSPLAGLRLYRAMRQAGAVVALTGDGSDELFAGYTRRYLPVAWRDAVLSGAWGRAWGLLTSPHLRWRDAAARMAWNLPGALLRAMLDRRAHMSVLHPAFRAAQADRLDGLTALQRLDLQDLTLRDGQGGGLLAQILRYADRNAMACGMESRSPFLDYRIVELSARLPVEAKLSRHGGKLVLRDAMRAHLPGRVSGGLKNRGLGHAEQFRISGLALGRLLDEPPAMASDVIDATRLAEALRRHPGDSRLWWPVCMLLWLRQVETQWG